MRCGVWALSLACATSVSALSHEFVVGLRLRNPAQLEELFWSISTPGSPEYLKHRSVEQLAELVGADDKTISDTKAWLMTLGAEPTSMRVSELRDTVTASFLQPPSTELLNNWGGPVPRAIHAPVPVDFVLRRDAAPIDASHLTAQRRRASGLQFGPSVAKQKEAYGIPADLQATNDKTLQMVWGPGTFGYSKSQLEFFKSEQCPNLNMKKVVFDTDNHGSAGGDNYGEGNLDVKQISCFGLNASTLVSNTNTSSSTEEGKGFGQALLDFVTNLPSRKTLPQVLSMSLGSLSAKSCHKLCAEAVKEGVSDKACRSYLQQQRQVCMYLSEAQVARINQGFQLLGTRGVTMFGSSGDGGSHFSFERFEGGEIADTLNKISCKFQMPVFPTASPYIISVGGTAWEDSSGKKPVSWSHAGGGFSWQFAAPAHQTKTVGAYLSSTSGLPPTSSFNASGRGYPDIAAISSDGTSESSPKVAGIWSLLMDHRLNQGLPPLGFLGPRLWSVMEKYPGEAFQDITSGNTKTSCDNGFPATKGWDPASGWGRPQWDGMLKHFGSDS